MTAESPTLDDPSKEACETADKLIEQAKALNPLDGEVWAKEALNDLHIIGLGYDRSPARMGNAAAAATRAMELNPNSYAARSAHAQVIHYVVAPPGGSSEAEHLLRELLSENPNDLGNQITLAHVLRSEGRFGEAADFCMKVNLPLLAAYIYLDAERFDKANAAADQALKMKRSVMNLQCKILMMQIAEDRNAALSLIDEIPPSAYTDDKIAEALASALLLYREPEKALKVLNSFPRDWMVTWTYSIPKAAYKGTAHMLAGRLDAARAEWNVALQQIERKLSDEPNNPVLLTEKASILAYLDQREEGARILRLCQQLLGQDDKSVNLGNYVLLVTLGHRDDVITWLEDILKNQEREYYLVHSLVRFDFRFDSLRGDPRFEKLLRDTLPKYAKPFDEPVAKAAPAPESGR